ncbi:hypothetical protein DLD77_08795 [Chitinophaga alhagiae]|uniref:Uncharacterized protein n=1 Tax=Chitinophaga alhagiae TaxID=2203219 RepID=A0ABN5LQW5_9BACT|nr:hypothetical protein [Chitinophaga alhagiae]AWO01785.1 hypothetical protein DLD77_08795 [Chitinophaga alhagiae]
MKISTMRSRLHEGIRLASDEKIRLLFHIIPLEISRSEHLTLEQMRQAVREAEEILRECTEQLKGEKTKSRERVTRVKEIMLVMLEDEEDGDEEDHDDDGKD